MNDQEIQEYKALYLQTAQEYIDLLTKQLPAIASADALDDLFRAAHSLKSQSLVMQYLQTGKLAGFLEKIFRGVKDKTLALSPALQTAVAKAVAVLNASIASITRENTEADTTEMIETLEQVSGQKMIV